MMDDKLKAAIDFLLANGKDLEAHEVMALRQNYDALMNNYHAGQRASYDDGMRTALAAQPAEAKQEPVKPRTGPMKDTPTCSTHPEAPHGFNRNGSHNAGRYMCDCEGWEPDYDPAAAQPAPAAVPPGYVLAPIEPTEAMLRAGSPMIGPSLGLGAAYAEAAYRAMIVAAGDKP